MKKMYQSTNLLTTFVFLIMICAMIPSVWAGFTDYPDYTRNEVFIKHGNPPMSVTYTFKRSVAYVSVNGRYGSELNQPVEWLVGYTDGTYEVFPFAKNITRYAPPERRIASIQARHYKNDKSAIIHSGIAALVLAVTERDFDEDGLNDIDEVNVYKLDPLDPDVDNDGLPDGWEIKYGCDPKGFSGAPLAHWTLDDYQFFPDCTKICDVSGNDLYGWVNHHQENGIVEGMNGTALAFSTDNSQYGFINDRDFLDLTYEDMVTVSCWYKSTESNDRIKYLAVKGGYWNANYGLVAHGDYIQFVVTHSMGLDVAISYTPEVAESVVIPGGWHYLAGTFDGFFLRLYIDGVEVSSVETTDNGAWTYMIPNNDGLIIGHNVDGFIDDVRLYNHVLTEVEIAAAYEPYSDKDGDGLTVVEEYAANTDPNSVDGDNDGMLDSWEMANGFKASVLPQELQAWWTLDVESNPILVSDSSGNDNYGISLKGGNVVTASRTGGIIGESMVFEVGSDQWIPFNPNYTDLDPYNDTCISMCGWFKPTEENPGSYRAMAGKITYDPCYSLDFVGDNRVMFSLNIDGVLVKTESVPEVALPVGEWSHVAGVYDGTAVRIYINGIEIPEARVTTSGSIVNNDHIFRIGHPDPVYNMIGELDDLRIYADALDAESIAQIMEPGLDNDGDGISNYNEYLEGTDPLSP